MDSLKITAGDYTFTGHFETERAPQTVAAFRKHLPYVSQIVHVRWSGEGVWVPLGETDFGVGYENHTSHPAPGHILLYPGGISETEILLAYGGVDFSSKMGQLAGQSFHHLDRRAGKPARARNLGAVGRRQTDPVRGGLSTRGA